MKKKIAMFANEWNNENVCRFMEGMNRLLPEDYADIFCFVAANSYGRTDVGNVSESTIHFLADLHDFDYAIVFSNGLNSNELRDRIYARCEEAGITTFCVGDKKDGFYSMLIDNETGMRQLCEHLYTVHKVRRIHFIAGAEENEDSKVRLRVLSDFQKEKGLVLRDEDIFYSRWENIATINHTMETYKSKKDLPDAIVVANDQLAIAAGVGLDYCNLSAPQDYIVTGFDYSYEGIHYYPSMASVDQHYDIVGEKVVEVMLNSDKGIESEKVFVVKSEFIPGESCGCVDARDESEVRKIYCHKQIEKNYMDNVRFGRLTAIRNAILESSRFSTLPGKIKSAFEENRGNREGETMHILLDPSFESVARDGIDKMPKYTYTDYMQILVSKEDGEMNNDKFCKNSELIPGYRQRPGNRMYIFMPIYIETYVCGYMVMRAYDIGNINWDFHEYIDCILNTIKYYKTNIELTTLNDKMSDLMNMDALTSLKNRAAYENAKAALKRNYLAGDDTPFAVIMFDINYLKNINDELGHGAGDVYIKNSSELICNTFKRSPVFRIGGDEFVAIAKRSDYESRHELLKEFRNKIEELQNSDVPKLKAVSIASGMADFEEISDGGFELLFQKADERMYINKREMKEHANK